MLFWNALAFCMIQWMLATWYLGSSVHGIFQARVLEWVAIALPLAPPILTYGISHNHHFIMSPFPYIFLFSACRRMCPRTHSLAELTGQNVGLIPPLFYCFGTWLMLLLHGFVAKQTYFLEWSLTYRSLPYFFIYNPLVGLTGEGNGTPLQYSCLENPMDGGAC